MPFSIITRKCVCYLSTNKSNANNILLYAPNLRYSFLMDNLLNTLLHVSILKCTVVRNKFGVEYRQLPAPYAHRQVQCSHGEFSCLTWTTLLHVPILHYKLLTINKLVNTDKSLFVHMHVLSVAAVEDKSDQARMKYVTQQTGLQFHGVMRNNA